MDIQEAWRQRYRIDLESPRFVLRPLRAGDAEWITDLLCDVDVCEFLWECAIEPRAARRAAEAIVQLDRWRCHFGHWAIEDRQSGVIHGWTELSKLRPWSGPSDEIALSYVLRRQSWGQGIATEAAGRLLRYGFEVHQLNRVMAVIMSGNEASKRVLKKLGLHYRASRKSADGTTLLYFRIDAPAGSA